MIELFGVSAGYGKKSVIQNITLAFPKGKLTAVIGPNGSGKSTLVQTVIGIVEHSLGKISIDGRDASTMIRQEVAKKVAYLAQGKEIPDMTVEQMVLHGRFPHLNYPRRYTDKDHEIAWYAMKKMGIEEFAGKAMYTLSGGMRQKAHVAMALAQDTEYILLDEPTTYLDISHQLELMETLRLLADSGKGIVAVMHDLPLTFHFADNIVVIKDGGIYAHGTPVEINDSGMIGEVFGVELAYTLTDYHFPFS